MVSLPICGRNEGWIHATIYTGLSSKSAIRISNPSVHWWKQFEGPSVHRRYNSVRNCWQNKCKGNLPSLPPNQFKMSFQVRKRHDFLSLEQVPCLLGPSSLRSFPENTAAYLNLHIPHSILDRIRRHASITRNWFFLLPELHRNRTSLNMWF